MPSNPKRTLLLIPPLFASLIGLWAAYRNGISSVAFAPNFAALVLLGIPLLIYARKFYGFVNSRVLMLSIFSCLALDLCFFEPGIDGVQRWVSLGPVRLSVAMALMPLFLFILSRLEGLKTWAFAFAITALLVLQPDAGQTTAWAAGTIFLFLVKKGLPVWVRIFSPMTAVAGAAFAWTRPDPLLPVAHVERILHLLFQQGEGGILAMAAAIIGLFGPLLWKVTQKPAPANQALVAAFLAWFFTSFVVTAFGNFPVPVIGAGAAPVLGWLLMTTFATECEPRG